MENTQLIADGKNAFPLLLEEISQAEQSIFIRMFIWRNDRIGKRLAKAILEAAERGVQVTIVKDRYGLTCEYMEEDQTSMFHPDISLKESFWVKSLELMYHPDLFGKEHLHETNPLRDAVTNHPNIHLFSDQLLYDHTKLFIFDERIMVFGGVNIEDKENEADQEGRVYHDFMIRLEGENYVRLYRERASGQFSKASSMFAMNIKTPVYVYEIKERYLSLIHEAKKELTILMAYFSPVKELIEAITEAFKRGVQVRILIPETANVCNDINRKTMTMLYDIATSRGYDLTIYLHPGMPHTKLLTSEKEILMGSCNITANAFCELSELNYHADNDDSKFAQDVRNSAESLILESRKVTSSKDLSYDPIRAKLEGIKL